jgi:archaellum component FlaC
MSNELEKSWLATNESLQQLMHVMNEITARPKPLMETFELSSNRIIKQLQKQIDKLKAYLNKDGKNIKPANERAGNNSNTAQTNKRVLSR